MYNCGHGCPTGEPSRYAIVKVLPMFNNPIVPRLAILLLTGITNMSALADTLPEQVIAQVHQAALEQLQRQAERAGWTAVKAEAEVVRGSRPLPACRTPVTVDGVDTRAPARMRFVAACPGAEGWRYDFVVRGKLSAKVAVLAADVAAGKPLGLADVSLERNDITTVPDALADLAAVDGMSARRSLRAGEVLRPNMLIAALLVKRGEMVRIVAKREQIEVSMAGEALDAGARGAIVRVRNASGTTIRARVIDAGTVEPADLPGAN